MTLPEFFSFLENWPKSEDIVLRTVWLRETGGLPMLVLTMKTSQIECFMQC